MNKETNSIVLKMLIKNTKYLFPLKNLLKYYGKCHYLFLVLQYFSLKLIQWTHSMRKKINWMTIKINLKNNAP